MRHCTLFAAAMIAGAGLLASGASACPRCKVAAGGLADASLSTEGQSPADLRNDSPDPAATARSALHPFSISLGADVVTSYFHRGYLQQDHGVIFQPYLTLSVQLPEMWGWQVEPYVAWWNSLHDHSVDAPRGGHGRHKHNPRTETRTIIINDPGHPGQPEPHTHEYTSDVFFPGTGGSGKGWYETELMGGLTLTRNDWIIDANYRVFLFPENTHDAVQEIGAKISYDVAGFWDQTPALQRAFSLRPYVQVIYELRDANGDENTYIETGIEPSWRFRLFDYKIAVSTPVVLGGSPDGLYYDSDDDDTYSGYLTAALKASVALPVPPKFGHWFINGSVTYLHLIADSAVDANSGDRNEVIGSVGVGVSF